MKRLHKVIRHFPYYDSVAFFFYENVNIKGKGRKLVPYDCKDISVKFWKQWQTEGSVRKKKTLKMFSKSKSHL